MKIDRQALTVKLSPSESENTPKGDKALKRAEDIARQMSRDHGGAEARVLLAEGGQIASFKGASPRP